MLYIIVTIVLLLAALTLLRLRVRLALSGRERLVFVGLGRSGHEKDLIKHTGRLKLFGINVVTLKPPKEKKVKPEKKKEPKPKKKKPSRKRPLGDFLRLIPGVLQAVSGYFWSLVQSVEIEQLEGDVEAGFETPDVTGQVYGYYQAAVASVPSIGRRLSFTPDFTGPSFDGSARVALAIPLYRILLRTVALLFRLPLRKIIKLAIGRKKGD